MSITLDDINKFKKQINLLDFYILNPQTNLLDFYIPNPQTTDVNYIGGSHTIVTDAVRVRTEMYVKDFEYLVNIINNIDKEKTIRDRSETVRDAYDQYMILLKLSK